MSKTMLPYIAKQAIINGKLIKINCDVINLSEDEFCCFVDNASSFKDKEKVVGYSGKSAGINVRIAKGVSFRTGGSGGSAIRENHRTTFNGYIAITTKRIVFFTTNISFDKTFDKISSVVETSNGITIQIGAKIYQIIMVNHSVFMKAYKLIKSGDYQFATQEEIEKYPKEIKNIITNNKTILKIVLWIFLLPIMLCICVYKNDKISKKWKYVIIIGIIILSIIFIIINDNNSSINEENLSYINSTLFI